MNHCVIVTCYKSISITILKQHININNININKWAMLPEEHVGSLIKQRPRKHQLELVEQTLGQKLSKQRELQLSQFHRSCGKMNAFAS